MLGRREAVSTKSEDYIPRVKGSIPVKGNSFADFFFTEHVSLVNVDLQV